MPWYGWTALAGALIILVWNGLRGQWGTWPQAFALFLGGLGDYCLGACRSLPTGIVCFSLAHILYAIHACHRGQIVWKKAMALAGGCMILLLTFPFGEALMNVSLPLKIGGFIYLIITCLDIGIVSSRRPFGIDRLLCCLGVVLLAVSDVFLVCEQFIALGWASGFCLHFYFASVLFATFGGMLCKQ